MLKTGQNIAKMYLKSVKNHITHIPHIVEVSQHDQCTLKIRLPMFAVNSDLWHKMAEVITLLDRNIGTNSRNIDRI